jgi:TM2 domain-containing membrane protein YozV
MFSPMQFPLLSKAPMLAFVLFQILWPGSHQMLAGKIRW